MGEPNLPELVFHLPGILGLGTEVEAPIAGQEDKKGEEKRGGSCSKNNSL